MKQGKIAKSNQEALQIGETFKDVPHGWIQWKSTSVFMSVNCKCGYQSHIDAEFAYSVQCPMCGTIYSCNGHIELIELSEPPSKDEVQPVIDMTDPEFEILIENDNKYQFNRIY